MGERELLEDLDTAQGVRVYLDNAAALYKKAYELKASRLKRWRLLFRMVRVHLKALRLANYLAAKYKVTYRVKDVSGMLDELEAAIRHQVET